MELSEEQKQKFKKWLDTHWDPYDQRRCPICRNNKWSIIDKIFDVKEFVEKGKIVSRRVAVPLFVLTCKKCGYSIFFNAITVGIISPKKDARSKTKPKNTKT